MGDPEPETSSQSMPGSLTHRNHEVINVCCFKLLRFEVISYAAISDYKWLAQSRSSWLSSSVTSSEKPFLTSLAKVTFFLPCLFPKSLSNIVSCFLFSTELITIFKKSFRGFPGGAVVKNLPAHAGDTGSSPGLGRSHMPRSD